VKSVKSVVLFLRLRLAALRVLRIVAANPIQIPFHEPFMNYLPNPAGSANQGKSRLIVLFFVFRQSLARTFHSLAGRSCCLIQGGAAAPPCHSRCGNFRQRYEVSGLAVALALALLLMNHTVLAGGLPLPPAPVRDEAGGQALAAQIRSAVPEEDSEIHGALLISAGKTKNRIPVVCQVKRHEGTWETIYQTEATPTAGAERLAIVHSASGPNRYSYARAAKPGAPLPEPSPVLPADTETPFAGSDFSLGDLGLEFLHWPGQCKFQGNEERLGQPCYVLESTHSQPGGIVRVKSWIDVESLGLLVAEAYDSQSHKIKEFSLDSKSFKKDARGHWHLEEVGIDNKKTRSHTDLKFDMPKEQ
jgi:hypothetical protein